MAHSMSPRIISTYWIPIKCTDPSCNWFHVVTCIVSNNTFSDVLWVAFDRIQPVHYSQSRTNTRANQVLDSKLLFCLNQLSSELLGRDYALQQCLRSTINKYYHSV